MADVLSPELVLVLPPRQRAEAIGALPRFEPWQATRLHAGGHHVPARSGMPALAGQALLYFVARLALTLCVGTAFVLAATGVLLGLALVF